MHPNPNGYGETRHRRVNTKGLAHQPVAVIQSSPRQPLLSVSPPAVRAVCAECGRADRKAELVRSGDPGPACGKVQATTVRHEQRTGVATFAKERSR
jgi:hypothetical protein